MAAPAWTGKARRDAKRDGLVLFKLELNHSKEGSYAASGACTHRTALLLAAIVNTSGHLSEDDIGVIEGVFGIVPDKG